MPIRRIGGRACLYCENPGLDNAYRPGNSPTLRLQSCDSVLRRRPPVLIFGFVTMQLKFSCRSRNLEKFFPARVRRDAVRPFHRFLHATLIFPQASQNPRHEENERAKPNLGQERFHNRIMVKVYAPSVSLLTSRLKHLLSEINTVRPITFPLLLC